MPSSCESTPAVPDNLSRSRCPGTVAAATTAAAAGVAASAAAVEGATKGVGVLLLQLLLRMELLLGPGRHGTPRHRMPFN
jgi:hypothetical protein